jgi:hypothetical protein
LGFDSEFWIPDFALTNLKALFEWTQKASLVKILFRNRSDYYLWAITDLQLPLGQKER